MEEDERQVAQAAISRKHDGWSVLILSLGFAVSVIREAASYVENLADITAQHSNHLTDQNKFYESALKWGNDG